MGTVVVVGGTGYTGSAVVRHAIRRGHTVVSISRSAPADPIGEVEYIHGAVADVAPSVVQDADVVVAALSPRGDSAGTLPSIYEQLAYLCAEYDARFIAVGGYSSLRPADGEPRFVEGPLPADFAGEIREMHQILTWLQDEAPGDVDWLFVSPAGSYGAFNPGEALGRYRLGGEVALVDKDGESAISAEDFALAIVDEIDNPTQHRAHISVAY